MKTRKITVVTPVFNGCRLIGRTLESLRSQDRELRGEKIEIQHIIVDGGSNDGTLNEISLLAIENTEVICEPDHGMYDALAKGLARAQGDIVCYLNAGDMFLPAALKTVLAIFEDTDSQWITCASTHYCEEKMIVRAEMPYRYVKRLIRNGMYGTSLPFIQQESTFWRRELLGFVDYSRLRSFRLAGDYYLWWCFSSKCELDVAHTVVSGFSINAGQLSENKERYFEEMSKIATEPMFLERLMAIYERKGWRASPSKRLEMNSLALRYDHTKKCWCRGNR